MCSKLSSWLVLCVWICSLSWLGMAPARAAEPALDASQVGVDGVSLTRYFAVLEDPHATLTLDDVRRPEVAARFTAGHAPAEALGFSYTRSAVWLRLQLRNPADQPLQRTLEIAYALLASVDVYQSDAGGVYRKTELGYARPQPAPQQRHRFIVVPLELPARAEQVLYLRVQSANSLNIPARLWEPGAFQRHERIGYAMQALYFGVFIAIALYNLMLFVALRDVNYLLYVAFASLVALALANFTGLGPELWGGGPVWSMLGVNLPAAAASVVILVFTRRVLGTPALLPRMDRVLQGLVAANLLALVLLPLWFSRVAPLFAVLNGLTSAVLLLAGLVCAAKRQRSAYFFVAAYATILTAVVLTHLRNLGVLPTNVFTSEGTQIGSALEMLLLSFALAERYNTMRRDKARAQREALQAQGELVKSLRASEQELEARVEERTEALRQLNSRLEAISITDELTGIANRRRFDAVLANEWARAARSGQPLALGLLDVDWFKSYNDRYGHQAGDDCLRQVASVLAASLGRSADLVARYGGEEFAFVAPATDADSALAMARRVCEAIEALGLVHGGSAFGRLTASVGVATVVPVEGMAVAQLLAAADQALYAAKAQGRNLAVLAPAVPAAQPTSSR